MKRVVVDWVRAAETVPVDVRGVEFKQSADRLAPNLSMNFLSLKTQRKGITMNRTKVGLVIIGAGQTNHPEFLGRSSWSRHFAQEHSVDAGFSCGRGSTSQRPLIPLTNTTSSSKFPGFIR